MLINENHQIYSDEVQEILGRIPHWIIRSGIAIITISVLILISGSWYIKYPQIISGPITVTSQIPPIDIVAPTGGRLHLMIKDGDKVNENETLGYIESSSVFTDVTDLEDAINQISLQENKIDLIHQLLQVKQLNRLSLGEIQTYYENFTNHLNSILIFDKVNFHTKQIEQLQTKINIHEELHDKLVNQKALLKEEFEFAKDIFISDSLLNAKDFISERDLNNSRLLLLQHQRTIEIADVAILNNKILVNDYRSRIEGLTIEKYQEEINLISNIVGSIKILKSQISLWKQSYLLISPFNGSVVFYDNLVNNKYIQPSQEIMSVIPNHPNIYGIVHVPITGSGRIKKNQHINISLENYPSEEYGKVLGVVEHISPLPRENTYTIQVTLPNGLRTTNGKTLNFQQQMQGSADIITEDLRLLERIFYQFKNLVNRINK